MLRGYFELRPGRRVCQVTEILLVNNPRQVAVSLPRLPLLEERTQHYGNRRRRRDKQWWRRRDPSSRTITVVREMQAIERLGREEFPVTLQYLRIRFPNQPRLSM